MQDSVKALYHPDILNAARTHFGCDENGFQLLSESESFVYQYHLKICYPKNGNTESNNPSESSNPSKNNYASDSSATGDSSRVLRVTHSSHRSREAILQELRWIEFLRQHGIRAAGPISSLQGNLIETVCIGDSEFYLVSFERAGGRPVRQGDLSNREFLLAWGEFVGRMHTASAENNSRWNARILRPQWDEEWNVTALPHIVKGPEHEAVRARYREILEALHRLPKDEHYGIIHSDFESENFFVGDHNRITAFDFDESQYHWFIYDIAVIIRTFTWTFATKDEQETALSDFLEGYFSVYTLPFEWLRQLPLFLRLREVCIYAYLHGKRNPSSLNREESAYLESMKQRIENGIPCLDIQL